MPLAPAWRTTRDGKIYFLPRCFDDFLFLQACFVFLFFDEAKSINMRFSYIVRERSGRRLGACTEATGEGIKDFHSISQFIFSTANKQCSGVISEEAAFYCLGSSQLIHVPRCLSSSQIKLISSIRRGSTNCHAGD